MSKILEKYRKESVLALKEKFKFSSVMQVPRLEKIVLNMGVGEACNDKSVLDEAEGHMANISGQKPLRRRARIAVAGFKIREGQPLGCKVTIRGKMMWAFLEKLISVALPAVKDFRGTPTRLDGKGNYSLGIKDICIFPEVKLDDVKHPLGMDISFVTTAKTDEVGLALLKELGLPFKK